MPKNPSLKWQEPMAFVHARSHGVNISDCIKQFSVLTVVFITIFLFLDWPDTMEDWGIYAVMACSVAFTIAFIISFVLTLIPQNVCLDVSAITISGNLTPLSDIDFAVVGTTKFDSVEFPVLSFQTKDCQSFVVGLASKIDPTVLTTLLKERGVRVED